MATLYFLVQQIPLSAIAVLVLVAISFLPVFILNKRRKKPQKKTLIIWASISGILIVVGIASLVLLNQWERLDRLVCEKAGGTLGYVSSPPVVPYSYPFSCDFPTTDAGKECTDSSQCETFCSPIDNSSPVVGQCYGRTVWPNEGCVKLLKAGKIVVSGACSF